MGRTTRICSLIALALALTAPALAKRSERTPLGTYLQARVLDASGEIEGAATAYARALADSPGDQAIAARAYRGAIDAGNKRLALRAAAALRDSPSLPADAHLLLMLDAIERGDWAAARLEIDRIEERTPYDFLVPSLRAWVAFGGRDGDPLRHLGQGNSLSTFFNRETRILLLLVSGRWEEARGGLRLLSGTDGRETPLRIASASQLTRLGQRQAALDVLSGSEPALAGARSRIEAGQSPGDAIESARAGVAFLLTRLSADLSQNSRSQTGLAFARIASFAEPRSDTTRLNLARALSFAGQPDAALALLGQVGSEQTKTARIETLVRAGRDDEAIAQAGHADANLATLLLLGEIHTRSGRHPEAARVYKSALDSGQPGVNWQTWLLYGSALDAAGDWPGAKTALGTALALAPDQPAILNQLGFSMLERGDDLTQATQHIAKANRLQPDNAAITDSLGWAFHLRGRTAEAIPLLERAAAMRPDEATIGEHLGDAYWAMGRKVEARYSWTAALAAADGESETARVEARLRDGPPRAR